MKKIECYCHTCCELRSIDEKDIKIERDIAEMWDGLKVPYNWYYAICPVCGDEIGTMDMIDKSMKDLAENRKIVIELS